MTFNSALVTSLIELALQEDLQYGDVTSELCLTRAQKGSAEVLAREALIVSGLPILERIAHISGRMLTIKLLIPEGQRVKPDTVLARLSGASLDLLALERTMLNFVQRLSGISTATQQVIAQARNLVVLDTRKTTPGWRSLEKYAVRVGGAHNHRFSLSDLILVKNNHVDACGGMSKTLEKIFRQKSPYMAVEVEVRNLQELSDALAFHPHIIMLDNFSDSAIAKALALITKSGTAPMVEVSGGVTPARFAKLRKLGVGFVSMGALTTASTAVDISMRIRA